MTTEDRIALWDWRRDPIVRTLFPLEREVNYAQHRRWFDGAMSTEDAVWCVGLIETLRIGCVRFDRQAEAAYEVSMHLKPLYCGKEGLSAELLKAAMEYLTTHWPAQRIFATLTKVNPAAGKVFQRAGFQVHERDQALQCELWVGPREPVGV